MRGTVSARVREGLDELCVFVCVHGAAFLRGRADGPVPRICAIGKTGFRYMYPRLVAHHPLGLYRTFSRSGGII